MFHLSGFYAFYKISLATNPDELVSFPVVFISKKKIKKIKQKCVEGKVSVTLFDLSFSVQVYMDIYIYIFFFLLDNLPIEPF